MKVVSFYPGPSRVYSKVTEFLYEAYMDGVLSWNHRSKEFSEMLEKTLSLMKEKLLIPEDYEIIFTSSATECWEIIAQSLTREKSFHLYNGAFGEKWMNYAQKLRLKTTGLKFGLEEKLSSEVSIDEGSEIICITQNETSNGTQVSCDLIGEIKKSNPEKLLAVDATSSMGGIVLDFKSADIWFASVQKCFGLPAGMGIMILSPQAVQVSESIGENAHYNSLNFVLENFRKFQTPYTPNVMDIYLLMRTLEVSKGIERMQEKLLGRIADYEKFFEEFNSLNFLVKNKEVRSQTVLAIENEDVEKLKKEALRAGILVGNGYGEWKSSTFRIANFPAIKKRAVKKLKNFCWSNYK